jgi:hypothetical protein
LSHDRLKTAPDELLARWQAGQEPTWRETFGATRSQIDIPALPPRSIEDGLAWLVIGCLGSACLAFAITAVTGL